MNIEIANILYYMHQSVWKILEEYPEKIVDIVKTGADVNEYSTRKVKIDVLNSLCRIAKFL